MKNTLLYFFILFSLSTTQLLHANHDYYPSTLDQVFDIRGGKILIGSTYYVLPVPTTNNTTISSGLSLTNTTKTEQNSCPLDVVAVNEYPGFPVIFHAMVRREDVVNISRDVNIEFYAPAAATNCPQSSTVWKIDEYDGKTGKWFVTSGGSLGKPGKKTVRNWFKVEKYEEDYKIVYCPAICSIISCKPECSNVGVYVDQNQNKRLALTDLPLKVRFQQA